MSVDVRCGDALSVLKTLPAESVHMCCTSPPFWNLRDYSHPEQLGLEPTPESYVEKLVAVFREVRRVLHGSGTLWLNLGSTYAGSWGNQGRKEERGTQRPITASQIQNFTPYPESASNTGRVPTGWKAKDLIPIPWLVGLALQRDGWWLRSDCLWIKGNPMPSSVTDRPTPNHEYVLLLSKKPRYFYDAVAVTEPAISGANGSTFTSGKTGVNGLGRQSLAERVDSPTRNLRTAWHINTQPYSSGADVDHFAVFPPRLPGIAVLAGTSEYGCCPACLAPYERVVERPQPPADLRNRGNGAKMDFHPRQTGGGQKIQDWYDAHPPQTTGWQAACRCNAGTPMPCTVLDCFAGSGTVGQVAVKHRRDALLIELNPSYVSLIDKRLNGVQQTLPLDGEAS